MDVGRADDLHVLVSICGALRRDYDEREKSRKGMMSYFLKKKKAASDNHVFDFWNELHKDMGLIRPPIWYAVTECPECGFTEIISSKVRAKESLFKCRECSFLTVSVWVEERGKEKVTKIEREARYAFEAELIESKKLTTGWELKVREMHAYESKRYGCKVKKESISGMCPWCEDAQMSLAQRR